MQLVCQHCGASFSRREMRSYCSPACKYAARKAQFPERRHPLYERWRTMIRRCTEEGFSDYPRYGGRGITVCARWNDFFSFVADVGEPPSSLHTLDRIRNSEGYEPGNVRWALPKQQQRNTRKNHLVTINGDTRCIAEWAELSGIPHGILRQRIRRGWPTDSIFKEPRAYPR